MRAYIFTIKDLAVGLKIQVCLCLLLAARLKAPFRNVKSSSSITYVLWCQGDVKYGDPTYLASHHVYCRDPPTAVPNIVSWGHDVIKYGSELWEDHLFKPRTCPNAENKSPCRGGTRQYHDKTGLVVSLTQLATPLRNCGVRGHFHYQLPPTSNCSISTTILRPNKG